MGESLTVDAFRERLKERHERLSANAESIDDLASYRLISKTIVVCGNKKFMPDIMCALATLHNESSGTLVIFPHYCLLDEESSKEVVEMYEMNMLNSVFLCDEVYVVNGSRLSNDDCYIDDINKKVIDAALMFNKEIVYHVFDAKFAPDIDAFK